MILFVRNLPKEIEKTLKNMRVLIYLHLFLLKITYGNFSCMLLSPKPRLIYLAIVNQYIRSQLSWT